MKPCKQCLESCQLYREFWCMACARRLICRIRKNMTKEHKMQRGCEFECTDIDFCTRKEQEESGEYEQ